MPIVRHSVGAVLALVALLLGAWGLPIFLTEGAEIRPIGIFFLLLGLPFAVAAWWVFARTAHPRGWAVLGAVALLLAVALVTLGPRLLGLPTPMMAVGGALACLGCGALVASVWDWRAERAANRRPLR